MSDPANVTRPEPSLSPAPSGDLLLSPAALGAPLKPMRSVSVPTLVLSVALAWTVAWNTSGVIHVTHTDHSITVDWSGVKPTPVPPVPIPPGPDPAPAPVKPARLRVLSLYDKTVPLSRDQDVTLNSAVVRSYLTDKCAKDDDGRPAWRFWDKTTDVANESIEWQAAMQAAKSDSGPLPKMVVFDGSKLLKSYPITTEADAVAALRKWGDG